MNFSSPQFLTSFDPAIELHSEIGNINLPSESCFDDDIEAIHTARQEQTRNKVVIQHRAWNLSDVFRSDDEIGPPTPTKATLQTPRTIPRTPTKDLVFLPSSPPVRMPFIASPDAMAYAVSNDDQQKRKAGEADEKVEPKRQRMLGGFVDDDEDDDDDIEALRDEELKNQFELQDYVGPPADIHDLDQPTIITDVSQTADSTSTIVPTFQWEAVARPAPRKVQIKTCSGRTHQISIKKAQAPVSYERLIASRSEVTQGRATKSYYGIDIHKMLDDVSREAKTASAPRPTVQPSVENSGNGSKMKNADGMMWTEKYRARKFTDLIGDERTHRAVLRWMKGWESIVFPGLARSKAKNSGSRGHDNDDDGEEKIHRKVLLLSGPPGLGKTTLAHVCAKQAGYEVLEINASDDRSKDVVKGRIRDALGTENIKGSNVEIGEKKIRRAARPVCVIVDEVDGVVGGSGSSGEGGFMKALVDLVLLDQRNSNRNAENGRKSGKKRKGDNFRFLRPLIMVCNDLYHPSLRPLRAASIAEMIHVRQAPMENMVQRVKDIFIREGIPCDGDGARRLCEASWGLVSKRQRSSKNSGSAEGDIRSVLVAGEWVAHKLRTEFSSPRLTRNWLEQRVLSASTEGSSFFKEASRGGVREIVNRVFTDAGGFDAPVAMSFKDQFGGANDRLPVGVADLRKRHAINRLREMIDASGEHDKCINDCFAAYPIQQFQDDNYFSKPCAAYDWLHFHDTISHKVHASQEWELGPYLSQSVLAFHHLFASARGKIEPPEKEEDDDTEEHPFSGPRADFAAFEAQKQNDAILHGFHASFSAPMTRLFRSGASVTTELIPHLVRMLSPDVKPVIVRGQGDQRSTASVRKESERLLVQSAVRVMAGMGVTFEKVRVEHEGGNHGGWAYRMEPPIDELVAFSQVESALASTSSSAPVRYAVRQVLDQEYCKETKRKQTDHLTAGMPQGNAANGRDVIQRALGEGAVKRDFFGRAIAEPAPANGLERQMDDTSKAGRKVWVTYHEGFSNAVRKPISMGELMIGL